MTDYGCRSLTTGLVGGFLGNSSLLNLRVADYAGEHCFDAAIHNLQSMTKTGGDGRRQLRAHV